MIRLVVALAIGCACSPALAQKKMYRCGNQFQERPCEGPKTVAAPSAADKADPQQQVVQLGPDAEMPNGIHEVTPYL